MNTLNELIDLLNGEYSEEEVKKGHTPGGTFISQNSQGTIKKEKYTIKIYCFSNKGIRDSRTRDGSPYKIVLILPLELKKPQTIFPKTFFQKLTSNSMMKNSLTKSAKQLLKKYSLNENRELANYILNDSFLTENLPKHNLYISSDIQKKISTLNLRPNESVIEVEDLKKLYDIMNRLGEIIIEHKSILAK